MSTSGIRAFLLAFAMTIVLVMVAACSFTAEKISGEVQRPPIDAMIEIA